MGFGRSMRTVKLLRHLVASGTGKPAPTRAGTGSVVVVQGFEVAAALDPAERSMRARWRESLGD